MMSLSYIRRKDNDLQQDNKGKQLEGLIICVLNMHHLNTKKYIHMKQHCYNENKDKLFSFSSL